MNNLPHLYRITEKDIIPVFSYGRKKMLRYILYITFIVPNNMHHMCLFLPFVFKFWKKRTRLKENLGFSFEVFHQKMVKRQKKD